METIGLVCLYGITAFDDLRIKQVRMMEIIVFAIIGIIYDVICRPFSLWEIFGGVLVGVGLYLFSILSKEKMGKGDALIIMVSGLFLGCINTLILLWLSSVMAAVAGVIYTKRHGKNMEYEMPFVPFLLLAYIIMHSIDLLGGLPL